MRPHLARHTPAAWTPNRLVPSPRVRRYLYGLGVAAMPLVVFYGIATEDEAALWLALGSAALNGLALVNTPTGDSDAAAG